ncbi:MAG: RluA family pseudouridine synthase [Bryobacterales bacterium]|nr:RluA family pseudouridine synthase [Bryobacterales bacterium]
MASPLGLLAGPGKEQPAIQMKQIRSKIGRGLGKPDRRQLRVLYQDDAVVVLNKPAKMLAVPADDSDLPSALSLLAAELQSRRQRAFVVHRIDRLTSGILLFAKTWPDREALVRQFIEHTPVREYLAAVRGHLSLEEGTLVHYFRQEGMFQKVTTETDRKAVRAELRYTVEQRLKGASLVRVSLVTGLQNQIRVQFSAIGHPVIGDRKYNPAEKQERRITRVALHAAHLEFIHPRSGESVSVDCEPPPDFQALLQQLGLPASIRR